MDLVTKLTQPFSNLSFEEKKHRYFVENKPIDISVSGLISKFYEHFDSKAVAPYSAIKLGVTTEEVLKQWADINQESRDRGHRVHSFGELYQFNRSLKPYCPTEEAIVAFWASLPEHMIPVTADLRMYHFIYLFEGTADIILFDTKTQTYKIEASSHSLQKSQSSVFKKWTS